jgi:hypothetical protein
MPPGLKNFALIFTLGFLAGPWLRADDVTPEMEQAFLVKYKAALAAQDVDAYIALFCIDPAVGPGARAAFRDLATIGLAMDASSPVRSYAFIPAASAPPNKPATFDGKMYVDNLPAVIALKITFGKSPTAAPDEAVMIDSTKLLGIKDHQLMFVGFKPKS